MTGRGWAWRQTSGFSWDVQNCTVGVGVKNSQEFSVEILSGKSSHISQRFSVYSGCIHVQESVDRVWDHQRLRDNQKRKQPRRLS